MAKVKKVKTKDLQIDKFYYDRNPMLSNTEAVLLKLVLMDEILLHFEPEKDTDNYIVSEDGTIRFVSDISANWWEIV